MTSRPPYIPPNERANTVGATGGLPGANADPRAAELAPNEIESTVAAGDMPGDAAPDPADELGGAAAPDEHDHGLHTGDAGPDDESADGFARVGGRAARGEGDDLRRREGDMDADGGEADAEAATRAGLS